MDIATLLTLLEKADCLAARVVPFDFEDWMMMQGARIEWKYGVTEADRTGWVPCARPNVLVPEDGAPGLFRFVLEPTLDWVVRFDAARDDAAGAAADDGAVDGAVPVPVEQAAANDPEVARVLRDLQDGRLTLSTPSELAERPWAPEEVAHLEAALDEVLAR